MIMAERADPVDNKTNGQSYLDNDQFSITDIEHPLVSTTPTYSNILKNENEIERELFTITVPLETQRREENPFSFKHFLKRDNSGISSNCAGTSTSSCHAQNPIVNNTGARPKIFTAAINSTSPLTLPLDDFRTLSKKCKNVACDARCDDFCRHDCYNDSSKTAKTNSVEDISYTDECNPMKNLYRSYSDRDTSYKSLNTADNNFRNHKHITGRINSSEFSSALPDFVQDHIVLEQWYTGFDAPVSAENVEREINPNFSPMDRETRQKCFHSARTRSGVATEHSNVLPCDLMPGQDVPNRRANCMSVPLDLPRNDNGPFDLPRNTNPLNPTFSNPLDLPSTYCLDLTGNVNNDLNQHQDYMQEVPQILPDFLSDGAIHSDRLADLVQASPEGPGARRPDADIGNITDAVSRLSLENNRLRRELDCYRRQLSEQSSQISRLQTELSTTNQNEGQYTTKLATALETVEKNMARSNKRAIEAENTVTLLRNQIIQMTSEMLLLKNENAALRYGPGSSNSQPNNMARLSNELRTAATTAESSLRQLLNGVDNLRSLANSLESCNRVFEPSDENFDDTEDEGTGPAL